MGGLDICFGRWDTPQHVLADDPDVLDFEASENIWPGQSTGLWVMYTTGLNVLHIRQGL